jgi:hypothetical protein
MLRFRILALLLTTAVPVIAQRDSAAPPRPPVKFLRLLQLYDPDTQEPVAGVQVLDKVTGNSMTTSATGHIALVPEFVKATGALLEFRKLGYAPLGPILVDPLSDTTLLIPLRKAVVGLPTVVTTDRYNLDLDDGSRGGFDRRCAVHNVSCLGDSTLAANPSRSITEELQLAKAGVVRKCGSSARQTSCSVSIDGCTPRIVIDGFDAPLGMRSWAEIDRNLSPAQIEGIEIYLPGMVPMRYFQAAGNGRPSCAVLIWTKLR